MFTAVLFFAAIGSPMPTASLKSEKLDRAPFEALEKAIASGGIKKVTSVLVARHGHLVYESYFDGQGKDALRNTRSVTKTITGMLAGIAIEKKLLPGLDAKVFPMFADKKIAHPDPAKNEITVEHLLTMSSVLDCNDWDDDSPGNEEKMYPQKDWLQFTLDLPTRSTRGFSYCTAGIFTLGQVIANAAKMPIDAFAQKVLFQPLGIENVKWFHSPLGLAQTGGGLEMRSRDLLLLVELYLNKGSWNGQRVVPEAWAVTSMRPHARIDPDTEYGYLFWLKRFGKQRVLAAYMNGNGGNKVAVIPELDMTVVITTTNYNTKGMHEQTDRILSDYVLAAAHG
jgi:CubicO group peptidase (beta-lactamase class C family)